MKTARFLLLALVAATVSACASPQMASRNATDATALNQPVLTQPNGASAQATNKNVFVSDVRIAQVTVNVPRTLTVSEENSYLPKSDIVWRGDAYGDRYEQVKAIVEQSAANASQTLNGARPVHLHITLDRFHGLTEKARYRIGGVHNINMLVTLLDPETGAVLRPTRHVVTNLDALHGDAALEGDRKGLTQKYRVTNFLTHVISTELTQPGGYKDQGRGLFVMLNRK